MPVDLAAQLYQPTIIDANELLWAARILAGLVRVHRKVIPDMREKVKLAQAILESYADVRDFDPREQRWTVVPSVGSTRVTFSPLPFGSRS